jgi:hypothetical protein
LSAQTEEFKAADISLAEENGGLTVNVMTDDII